MLWFGQLRRYWRSRRVPAMRIPSWLFPPRRTCGPEPPLPFPPAALVVVVVFIATIIVVLLSRKDSLPSAASTSAASTSAAVTTVPGTNFTFVTITKRSLSAVPDVPSRSISAASSYLDSSSVVSVLVSITLSEPRLSSTVSRLLPTGYHSTASGESTHHVQISTVTVVIGRKPTSTTTTTTTTIPTIIVASVTPANPTPYRLCLGSNINSQYPCPPLATNAVSQSPSHPTSILQPIYRLVSHLIHSIRAAGDYIHSTRIHQRWRHCWINRGRFLAKPALLKVVNEIKYPWQIEVERLALLKRVEALRIRFDADYVQDEGEDPVYEDLEGLLDF